MSDFAKEPAPDATGKCGELVRYRPANYMEMCLGGMFLDKDGAYIRFDQAEELLAAERAEKEELKKALADRDWISHKHNEHRAKLKADNAALTARVKELTQLLEAKNA